ncbi:hypothetical protein [Actibacterium sp. 188UL27-1]|uniref:hypothetical protein n=1 Tax=Actibacterium sp. 188UL27-1 TaxID=2786961 RepID=UPI00195E1937|nr:hypothetical protein [Actibacterium sp. 188UL27-1]MBM7068862.1 hypothetical protein [Actibacterium sp. 188UL27-1]
MKSLSQILRAAPILYRPGVAQISFDEAWLIRLAEVAQRDDHDSFRFLLRSRIPAHAQRNLASLVRSVADQFRPIS